MHFFAFGEKSAYIVESAFSLREKRIEKKPFDLRAAEAFTAKYLTD